MAAWRDVVHGATFANVPRSSAFFASVALELWLQQTKWREDMKDRLEI
jgi:hypothetical protein